MGPARSGLRLWSQTSFSAVSATIQRLLTASDAKSAGAEFLSGQVSGVSASLNFSAETLNVAARFSGTADGFKRLIQRFSGRAYVSQRIVSGVSGLSGDSAVKSAILFHAGNTLIHTVCPL